MEKKYALLAFALVAIILTTTGIAKHKSKHLIGDINGDCVVGTGDTDLLKMAFNTQRGDWNFVPCFDLNKDYKVDIYDLAIIGLNYGESC